MFTFEFPAIAAFIVTLAATLYIFERFSAMIARDQSNRLNRIVNGFEKIHHDAANEIDDMSFDLYWGGIANDTKRFLKERMVVPDEIRDMIPGELLDDLLEPQIHEIRDLSRHLAIHARIGDKDRAYVNRLPKSLRKELTNALEEHREGLERQRTMLVGAGIDVDALEAHFSSR